MMEGHCSRCGRPLATGDISGLCARCAPPNPMGNQTFIYADKTKFLIEGEEMMTIRLVFDTSSDSSDHSLCHVCEVKVPKKLKGRRLLGVLEEVGNSLIE